MLSFRFVILLVLVVASLHPKCVSSSSVEGEDMDASALSQDTVRGQSRYLQKKKKKKKKKKKNNDGGKKKKKKKSAPTLYPTFSPKPSSQPSVSPVPTASPHPSSAPSNSPLPSFMPSPEPSQPPTNSPRPSLLPSSDPSFLPTASPIPSLMPSPLPSSTPSISHEPTMSHAPSASPAPTNVPSASPTKTQKHGPLRIKLYWKKEYMWQDKKDHKKYCLEADGSGTKIADCSGTSKQKWYVIGFTIRPYRNKKDCLTASKEYSRVNMFSCNGSSRQLWDGFDSKKDKPFELHPRDKPKLCVTNPHHPRDGEPVVIRTCEEARRHKTANWNRY